MSKLIIQKDFERLKSSLPALVVDSVRQFGLCNHVKKHPTAIVTVYLLCKMLGLSQEEFQEARKLQIDRLTTSLDNISKGVRTP